MAHTNENRHRQPWGMSRSEEASLAETMTSQLERVAAALSRLEARLDAVVLRGSATQATPHPIPSPPFSAPGPASVSYPRPEPDPPDAPPLYAVAHQPPSDPYQLDPYYQQPQPTYGPAPYMLPQPHHQNPNTYGYPPAPPRQLQPVRTRLPTCWDPPKAWQPPAWEPSAPYPNQLDWQKAYQPYTQPPHVDSQPYAWPQPPSHHLRHYDLPLPAQPYHQGAPQQQSTSSSIELPPYYAAPRPWHPLQPLPVTAPLFASDGHLQLGVSSSRKKEEDANLPDGEEKLCERDERLIELNRMLKQNEKENDSAVRREKEVNNNFSKLVEKEIKSKDLKSKLEMKEKDLRVLLEKPSKNEEMEIQSLVAIEIKDHDLEVEMEEKRGVFEDELRLKSEELVQKESAISHTMKILKKRGLTCAYDPGGNTSPKPLFATLFVVSWFPP